MRNLQTIVLSVLAVVAWVGPQEYVQAQSQASRETAELGEAVGALKKILVGKDARHRLLRDQLDPLFRSQDGRDRFVLNLVARVQKANITDGRVRDAAWTVSEVDTSLGYARGRMRLKGRWHGIFPRFTEIPVRWRFLDGRWYVLPPEKIELDPQN